MIWRSGNHAPYGVRDRGIEWVFPSFPEPQLSRSESVDGAQYDRNRQGHIDPRRRDIPRRRTEATNARGQRASRNADFPAHAGMIPDPLGPQELDALGQASVRNPETAGDSRLARSPIGRYGAS